jgi:hypothetical protein
MPRSSAGFSFLKRFLRRPAFYMKQRGLLMPIRMFLLSRYRRIPVSVPPRHRDWVVDSLVQRAFHGYIPKKYMGHILLFMSQKRSGFPSDPKERINPWRRVATGPFDAYVIPGEHLGMFRDPNVQLLAQQLRMHLDRVQATED